MGNPPLWKYRSAGLVGGRTIILLSGMILWMTLLSDAGAMTFKYDLESAYDTYATFSPYESYDQAKETNDTEIAVETVVPSIFPGRCVDLAEQAKNWLYLVENPNWRDPVITILSNCTRADLQQIRKLFQKEYGEDLVEKMKEAYGTNALLSANNFEKLVIALTVSLSRLFAERFNTAVDKHDFNAIRQVLTPLNDFEVQAMSDTYRDLYGKDIREHRVGSYVLEFLKTTVYPKLRFIIHSQLQGLRSNNNSADYDAACKDARKIIMERNANKWINDTSSFHNILMTTSFPQLRLIGKCFKNLERLPLVQAITVAFGENGFNNVEAGKAYADIVQYASMKKDNYYAEILNEAIKNRDHETLIFVVAWRASIDLGNIKKAYYNLHQTTLYNDVAKLGPWFVKDYYIKLMLAVIGN